MKSCLNTHCAENGCCNSPVDTSHTKHVFTSTSKSPMPSRNTVRLAKRRWVWIRSEEEAFLTSVCPLLHIHQANADLLTGKLSNLVRSVAQKDGSPRSSATTPMPWDRQTAAGPEDSVSTRDYYSRHTREPSNRDSRDSQRMRIERLGINQQNHSRNDSGTNASSAAEFEQTPHPRKHDYDLHAMETTVPNAQLNDSKNSIPAPSVTVRSEFPTLTRSRQQQSLACLVTIEVPEGRWQASYEDLQNTPPVPPLPAEQPNARAQQRRQEGPPPAVQVPYESPEVLEEITEELRIRVDNWHGLEFQR